MYHSGKQITQIKASVRIKGKPTKIWLPRQYNNKLYQESTRNSSKLTEKTKKNKTDEVWSFISTFNPNNLHV